MLPLHSMLTQPDSPEKQRSAKRNFTNGGRIKDKEQALQGGLDCLDQFLRAGRGHAAEPLDGFSVLADQNFAEVPFHVSLQRTFFANDALVQRVTVGTVDVYFRVHREGHSVSGRTKFFDLFFGAGFLTSELIAGKTANHETLVFEFLVQLFQTLVLTGEPAFGCDVDHKDNFALVLGKRGFLSIDILEFVIVNGTCVGGG